jgi:hypothetical protein
MDLDGFHPWKWSLSAPPTPEERYRGKGWRSNPYAALREISGSGKIFIVFFSCFDMRIPEFSV